MENSDLKVDNNKRFVAQPGELKMKGDTETETAIERINKRTQLERLEAYEKYMPLGSVITLKNYECCMIVGYNSDNGKDYLGCDFPFGINSTNGLTEFNHEDIKAIHKIGYLSTDSILYRRELKEMANNNDKSIR